MPYRGTVRDHRARGAEECVVGVERALPEEVAVVSKEVGSYNCGGGGDAGGVAVDEGRT